MRCQNHIHYRAPSGEETTVECVLEAEPKHEQHNGWLAVHWNTGHVHEEPERPMPDSPGGP